MSELPQEPDAAAAKPDPAPEEAPPPQETNKAESAQDYLKKKMEGIPLHDPYDLGLFDEKKLIRKISGEKCNIPGLVDSARRFELSRCLVIAGAEANHCCWAATSLVDQQSFSRCYASDSIATSALTTAGIVQRLISRKEPTCIILDNTYFGDDRSFARQILEFKQSTLGLSITPHAFIVYVKPQAIQLLAGSWPEHITLLEVPDQSGTRPAEREIPSPERHIEHLFAPSMESFEELAAAENRLLIARTLVRLVVLFPDLSTGNIDTLLKTILRGNKLEISAAKDRIKAKTGDAADLWTSHRSSFERQAGLVRGGSDKSPTLRFVSAELEACAQNWVWRYPEDLFDLFASISRIGILFGDYLDEDEEELYNSYIAAATELAHRAPKLFGARWLETLLQEFADWVHSQTPEVEEPAPAEDIFSLLNRLAGHQKRTRFWARFAHRMAVLSGALFRDESGQIVTRFFERLVRRDLYELTLRIIARMGNAFPAEQRLEWIERVVNDGDQDARQAAARDLALQIAWNPEGATPYLETLSSWLKRPDSGEPSRIYETALAFPVLLFQVTERRHFDPHGVSSPLLAVLKDSTGHSLARQFCEAAVTKAAFPEVAADHLLSREMAPENRAWLALALTLFQCAAALPDSELTIACGFAKLAFGSLKISEQNRVVFYWKEIASQCLTEMPLSTASPKLADLRKTLERRYLLANALIRN